MKCGQACAESCSAVSNTDSAKCRDWAAAGECNKNPAFMLKDRAHAHTSFVFIFWCIFSYFVIIDFVDTYVIRAVLKCGLCENPDPFFVTSVSSSAPNLCHQLQECANSCPSAKREMDECKQWAMSGECDRNPEFMLQKCASICGHLKQDHFVVGPDRLQQHYVAICFKCSSFRGNSLPLGLEQHQISWNQVSWVLFLLLQTLSF